MPQGAPAAGRETSSGRRDEAGSILVTGPRWSHWPLVASVGVILLVSLVALHRWSPLYYAAMALIAAPLLQRHQGRAAGALRRIPLWAFPRFLLLGFGAVLAEEALVGTLYAVDEGLGTSAPASVWVERMSEFIAYNLLAFAPIVVALYVAARTLALGPLDLWWIVGGVGIVAEDLVAVALGSPLVGLALMLPTMAIYTAILTPAILSLREADRGTRQWPWWIRVPAAWALVAALALPSTALLGALRDAQPGAFPSCDYIACD